MSIFENINLMNNFKMTFAIMVIVMLFGIHYTLNQILKTLREIKQKQYDSSWKYHNKKDEQI